MSQNYPQSVLYEDLKGGQIQLLRGPEGGHSVEGAPSSQNEWESMAMDSLWVKNKIKFKKLGLKVLPHINP